MQFTDEEIETIKEVFQDWGNDCPYTNYDKVHAIGVKLGIWEEEKPPTEEELQRRKEFAESPMGVVMSKMFKRANDYYTKPVLEKNEALKFMKGDAANHFQWPEEFAKESVKIGSKLKIRMTSDYTKKED